jgi:murein L,D-transpeptidase YcbB/YkuD
MNVMLKRALCAALMTSCLPAAPALAELPGAFEPTSLSLPQSSGRSILIDAAAATLYMIEDGRIVDSMKVIVGKPEHATPELKTSLTYATLNPYWHVPPDIARTLTAPNVLKQGISYLTDRGYEVVSSFGPDAEVLDPTSVDWQAVADGEERVLVRQRPGPANSMGRMKFSLAAGQGIFLHDTPKKELFEQDNRSLSSGCIRLEDAPRLARWLLGGSVPFDSSAVEEHIALRSAVPVTITYLDPAARMQLASLR